MFHLNKLNSSPVRVIEIDDNAPRTFTLFYEDAAAAYPVTWSAVESPDVNLGSQGSRGPTLTVTGPQSVLITMPKIGSNSPRMVALISCKNNVGVTRSIHLFQV